MMTRVVARGSKQEVVDRSGDRLTAMTLAAQLHQGHFERGREGNRALLDTAEEILFFLIGLTLRMEFGPVVNQGTGQPTGTVFGGLMAQLHDDEKVSGTIKAIDAKGFEVPDDPSSTADDVTYTSDDETIATIVAGATPRDYTITAGNVGSCVVSATIGDRVITQAIDVIPGDIAAMSFELGTPEKQ
jgi:hypothetical protein